MSGTRSLSSSWAAGVAVPSPADRGTVEGAAAIVVGVAYMGSPSTGLQAPAACMRRLLMHLWVSDTGVHFRYSGYVRSIPSVASGTGQFGGPRLAFLRHCRRRYRKVVTVVIVGLSAHGHVKNLVQRRITDVVALHTFINNLV